MNPQLRLLLIAYAASVVGLLAGLIIMRAGKRAYWRSPVYGLLAMGLGILTWTLLRKHLLPTQWATSHAQLLFYCAIGLYSTLGLLVGLLLGRLTQRKTPGFEEQGNA